MLSSSTKREIRQFHVVVAQRRQKNMYKKGLMHVQSCRFANETYSFFAVLVAVAVVVASALQCSKVTFSVSSNEPGTTCLPQITTRG